MKTAKRAGGRRKAKKKSVRKRAGGRGGPARKKASGRGGGGTQSRPREAAEKETFVGLKTRDGCAAVVVVAEHAESQWDRAGGGCEIHLSPSKTGRGATRGKAAPGMSIVQATRSVGRVCEAMAAVGHVQRARLMVKLLEGPATYRALQRITGLKAGPLYHHVSQLRLAGLILPKQRDLYELTRGGRNLILTAMAVGPLVKDKRRRPVPAE